MKIVVLCPHFAPDTAPTGTVMTGIVEGLVDRGHEIHVVTSLPWYRDHQVEEEWTGRLSRTETTEWGSITRVHPFPAGDKRNLLRRALGFVGFTALVGITAARPGGWFRKVDAVLAMSPPLTLGLTGWLVAKLRRGRFVFNIQDVFPDAAVRTGAITNRAVIRAAYRLERLSYRCADAVTVLSDDLADNVNAKLESRRSARTDVVVIPNFVDNNWLTPVDGSPYRDEFGLGDGPIVMYAGNLGYSQSLDLMIDLAEQRPEITVVINGDGAMRDIVTEAALRLSNLHHIGYQPAQRLPEVLSAADIHVVPLRTGLGSVSVPSKTYSILAVGKPVIAAIDEWSA
ncbi:MAG: glycosyltransferase family 4 protein, partial [Actinomycetota bacterium]|nr:glycosyltransferase family 4 protein [Actinomycetota bacterium]